MAVIVSREIVVPSNINFVDFVQTTGVEYINTGFKPNPKTRVVCDLDPLSTNTGQLSAFGARIAYNNSAFSVFSCYDATHQFYSDYGTNFVFQNADISGRRVIDKNKNITNFGNNIVIEHPAAVFQSNLNLFLCCLNENGTPNYGLKAKYYSFKIYDNGGLVHDYKPCIDSDGIVCFYDEMAKQYVYNAGTGVFTAG